MENIAEDWDRHRPSKAWCDDRHLHVRLADGREIATPLWWYPTLSNASHGERQAVELSFSGLHWPHLDEDLCIHGMLNGWKYENAVKPRGGEDEDRNPERTARPATVDDADFVLHLEELCMRPYAEALWGAWSPRPELGEDFPGAYEILQADGLDRGCIHLRVHEEHIQLEKLYLHPNVRNRGWGEALVRTLSERADAQMKPLRLRVLANNPARRLYQRNGFVVVEETPERLFMERAVTKG